MRRRKTQRAHRSTVLGNAADAVEVRVLLSADIAAELADQLAAEPACDDQAMIAVELPQDMESQVELVTDPIVDFPVAFEGELPVLVAESEPELAAQNELTLITSCGLEGEPNGVPPETPQLIICEPFDPQFGVKPYQWQEPQLPSATSVMGSSGSAGRLAQRFETIVAVAQVSGAVNAQFELASDAQYDQDGNLVAPAILSDQNSGIRYWQPKSVTLTADHDLSELLQSYGMTDYSVDETGAWQVAIPQGYAVELFNLTAAWVSEASVQAQIVLQPVDGQDATPLLIQTPESQVTVSYQSTWSDPVWPVWERSTVQIQASGGFNGTFEVVEAPQWDAEGVLTTAGVLLDVQTGLRYQSPVSLAVTGDGIEQLDQLLADPQWTAGLDTKIVNSTSVDQWTRLLELAPATGYDVLQLAARLTELTGVSCQVTLPTADRDGQDLSFSTTDTALFVDYPVMMYARGPVDSGTLELGNTNFEFGEMLTEVADGPVAPPILADSVRSTAVFDGPVFAMSGPFATNAAAVLQIETAVTATAADRVSDIRAERMAGLQAQLVRELLPVVAGDNTLSRVSAIASAIVTTAGRGNLVSGPAVQQGAEEPTVAAIELPEFAGSAEIEVQPTESIDQLQVLPGTVRRRSVRPVQPQVQPSEVPVDVPSQQPDVVVPPATEAPAAQRGPTGVPVSMMDPTIDRVMAALAAAGFGQ